jgi:hypothetical protein
LVGNTATGGNCMDGNYPSNNCGSGASNS